MTINMRIPILLLLLTALLMSPATIFALDVGERAPNFTAESTRGKVSLADDAGRLVEAAGDVFVRQALEAFGLV